MDRESREHGLHIVQGQPSFISLPPGLSIFLSHVSCQLGALGFPIYVFRTQVCNSFLSSLVDLFNKHIRLAQMWRMSRAALFHLRLGHCCKRFLVLSGDSLIILTDEVGRWNIAPGSASELGRLHTVRLRDQPRSP